MSNFFLIIETVCQTGPDEIPAAVALAPREA
jgi:hypothetical protein